MGPHRLGDGILARWRKLGNGFHPPWVFALTALASLRTRSNSGRGILGGEVER
jgi:hypothetical protein